MPNVKRPGPLLTVLALLALSLACGLQGRTPQRAVSPKPGSTTTPPGSLATPTLDPKLLSPTGQPAAAASGLATEQPTAAPGSSATLADDGITGNWQQLGQGLDRRRVSLLTDEGNVKEILYMLRIDPEFYFFDIGYRPGAPQRLMEWQQETGGLIVVNGGFFTAENVATGLIIANGHASGTSYAGFGGMLAITDSGPDLRSLSQQPYNANEPLIAALQSFPILIDPGGQIGYPQEDGLADRRTVIAQDRRGRILLILATTGSLTLHQMSRYLAESDLDVDIALNLDGGASTGIQLAEPPEGVAPFSLLPVVIIVNPKS